jgi:hypothetical protein
MAEERDFEILDDYLSDRLGEQDRAAFEQRLQADPDLRHEYTVQKQVIEGIRAARVAELKAMLNNVPVPSGNTGNALSSKIALGAAATLVVAAGLYFFLKEDEADLVIPRAEEQIQPEAQPETTDAQPAEADSPTALPQAIDTPAEEAPVESDKNQTSAGTEHSKPSLARRPGPVSAPDVSTPRADIDRERGPSAFLESTIAVETTSENPQYAFHYQFKDGKLLLFGPFRRESSKVIELASGASRRAFYLAYEGKYYLLPDSSGQIKPLMPLKDSTLIQKLSEFGSK